MSSQFYTSLVGPPGPPGPGTLTAAATSAADISPTPGISVIGGQINYQSAKLLVIASGTYVSTASPTLTLALNYGGQPNVIAAVPAFTPATTATVQWNWRLEWLGTVRTIGPTGTIFGTGLFQFSTSLTAVSQTWLQSTTTAAANAAITIDTTTTKALTISTVWSTATAGNSVTCHDLTAWLP